jgi:archaellin
MKRFVLVAVVLVFVAVVAAGVLPERAPAQGAKPYEGTTIRAVVNAEYVKYSL